MLAQGALDVVSEILRPDDFYRESHGLILKTALDLYGRGEPVDSITVVAALEQAGKLDKVGGRSRVHELAALVPATANVGHYAQIVKRKARLRAQIAAAGEIADLAWNDDPDAFDRAQQLVFGLTHDSGRGELEAASGPLGEVFRRIGDLYERGDEVIGTPSGFRSIDRLTLGFQPQDLVILGARPSIGKSALALSIIANLGIRENTPVAFFSLEMSKQVVVQRLLSLEANVDLQRIRNGKLSSDDWPRLTAAGAHIEKAPIYIDDTGGLTLTEIRAKSRRLCARNPVGLVVVDYLGLIGDVANARPEHLTAETGRAALMMKQLAKDLDIPVMLLAQLNRNLEQRADKRPILSDLRQSGDIEAHADLVMFLYRDDYYNDETEHQGVAELNIAKHRNGPTQMEKLSWMKARAKFGDLARV